MQKRLQFQGGEKQQDRMIQDKLKSLNQAINYSYQGAKVRKLESTEIVGALINPNKINQDYDEKIISIGFEYGYQPGDIFEWVNTGTKWLIYLQELTELAYFRGNIRKCSYEISWEDANGIIQTTYAAIRGPQQQGLQSLQKFGMSLDLPNYTLQLLLPNRRDILEQFERYSKFYLKNLNGSESNTCWRVEARDIVSTPGIIEIYAAEYYANKDEDDIEQGIVGGLIVKPTENEVISNIEGETFIKPRKTYTYIYTGTEKSEWLFDTQAPIEVKINNQTITIKWLKNYSGQFDLSYGLTKKTIVVESLF